MLAVSLCASSQAQERSSQPVEAAALALPEDPVPQNSAPAATATGSKTKQEEHDKAEQQLKQEEQQHLLGVVPNFNVVLNGQALPISGRQKWDLALHGVVDPFYFGWAFVYGGGESELTGSNSGYGWGPAGYFKRVGANYADNVNGALIGNALLPQLLHQDPRYFRKGTGSIKSRIWTAALSTVVCKGDNGKTQFNVSNVLGNYISGGISNLYYPANQRGVSQTLETGTEVTLFGALGGQMYEFAPDLIRIVFHRHSKADPAATPVASPAPSVATTPR
jgi:hypothetical protein